MAIPPERGVGAVCIFFRFSSLGRSKMLSLFPRKIERGVENDDIKNPKRKKKDIRKLFSDKK